MLNNTLLLNQQKCKEHKILHSIFLSETKNEEKCSECNSQLIETNGELVCQNCGLVQQKFFKQSLPYKNFYGTKEKNKTHHISESKTFFSIYPNSLGSFIDLKDLIALRITYLRILKHLNNSISPQFYTILRIQNEIAEMTHKIQNNEIVYKFLTNFNILYKHIRSKFLSKNLVKYLLTCNAFITGNFEIILYLMEKYALTFKQLEMLRYKFLFKLKKHKIQINTNYDKREFICALLNYIYLQIFGNNYTHWNEVVNTCNCIKKKHPKFNSLFIATLGCYVIAYKLSYVKNIHRMLDKLPQLKIHKGTLSQILYEIFQKKNNSYILR